MPDLPSIGGPARALPAGPGRGPGAGLWQLRPRGARRTDVLRGKWVLRGTCGVLSPGRMGDRRAEVVFLPPPQGGCEEAVGRPPGGGGVAPPVPLAHPALP